MIELSDIYLRASVAHVCNMDCVYCPKSTGMENRVPPHLTGAHLSSDEYIKALERLGALGIRKVSFTGGEPTLNRDLGKILVASRGIFDVVELTSNGKRLKYIIPFLADNVDLLKVSLDTLRPSLFAKLTSTSEREYWNVQEAIWAAARVVPRMGINFVYSVHTQNGVEEMVDFVKKLNSETKSTVHLSVLDYYYSSEKKLEWQANYAPISELEKKMGSYYYMNEEIDRFGCRFVWFDVDGVKVRIKDSVLGTMRSDTCNSCEHYCQEGMYGLKLSTVGWVTPCPVNDSSLGFEIAAWTDEEPWIVSELRSSSLDDRSFEKMMIQHNLSLNRETD